MGPTRRSARLADHVVLLGATAADSEGVPRSSAKALGSGADLCLALPQSTIQSRLRTTVCYQRGADLRRDGSPHGPEVSQNLSFQTVFSTARRESAGDCHSEPFDFAQDRLRRGISLRALPNRSGLTAMRSLVLPPRDDLNQRASSAGLC